MHQTHRDKQKTGEKGKETNKTVIRIDKLLHTISNTAEIETKKTQKERERGEHDMN